MKVMHRWQYFTGTYPQPVPADRDHLTKDETNAMIQWDYDNTASSFFLSQELPDMTEICLINCTSTKEQWDTVTKEYQAKSTFTQGDLHQAFLDIRCTKGGNVREFLTSLGCKHEELAAARVRITEKEYKQTILRGIPANLATFASHLLSSAAIIDKLASINLDALVSHVCEEADQLKSRRVKGKGGKQDPQATDEALSATASDNRRRGSCKGKCHNCGRLGHWAKKCCSPKKDKEGESAGTQSAQALSKPKNRPVGLVNTIYDFKGDGFWMATEEAIDRAHLASTEPDPMLGVPDDFEATLHQEGEEEINLRVDLGEEELIGAVITLVDDDSRLRVELYDSSATRHISPYKTDFTSYSPLSPPHLPQYRKPAALPGHWMWDAGHLSAQWGHQVGAHPPQSFACSHCRLHPHICSSPGRGGIPCAHQRGPP